MYEHGTCTALSQLGFAEIIFNHDDLSWSGTLTFQGEDEYTNIEMSAMTTMNMNGKMIEFCCLSGMEKNFFRMFTTL